MSDAGAGTHYYKAAADRGDASAQSSLAVLYHYGRGGLPQDRLEAARLYKLAADQGFVQAQNNLGTFTTMAMADCRRTRARPRAFSNSLLVREMRTRGTISADSTRWAVAACHATMGRPRVSSSWEPIKGLRKRNSPSGSSTRMAEACAVT